MLLNRLNLINKSQAGAVRWTDFWITQGVFLELWDLRKKDTDGNSMGLMNSNLLTIIGNAGNETYQCPNTTAFKNADTDSIWFTTGLVRRTVTTNELRGYDFLKTIVKYMNEDPFTLEAIGILNLNAIFDDELFIRLYNDFKLNQWRGDDWIDAGEVKENRPYEQTLWTP
jgi:hypothetical protein